MHQLVAGIQQNGVTNGDTSNLAMVKQDDLRKFVCKSNGVLFENDVMQVGYPVVVVWQLQKIKLIWRLTKI